jgi:hypothetical protein
MRGWDYVKDGAGGEPAAASVPTGDAAAAAPADTSPPAAGPAVMMAVDHGVTGTTGTESAFTNDGSDVIARDVAVDMSAPLTTTPEAEVRSISGVVG